MKNGMVKDTSGIIRYYKDNVLHREDGPAIIYPDGYQEWIINGKTSRKGGPAIIYPDGYKEWVVDNITTRIDGPAVIRGDGTVDYYINGIKLSKEEFDKVSSNLGQEEY